MLDFIKPAGPKETPPPDGKTGSIEIQGVTVTFGKGAAAHKAVETTTLTIQPVSSSASSAPPAAGSRPC